MNNNKITQNILENYDLLIEGEMISITNYRKAMHLIRPYDLVSRNILQWAKCKIADSMEMIKGLQEARSNYLKKRPKNG